jgi:predicted nucleic acid-binding Zn ribbon protein
MPTYRFKNNETGEEFEKFMKISEREQFLTDNPNVSQMPVPTRIVHETGTNLKIDDGFREVLGRIKNTYKINNIKSY